jgi:O-antigen/teichoic acid export membrane protein
MSEGTLRQRVVKAFGWGVFGNFSSQLLRLVSNLILTRLLAPEAFGLMAVVIVLAVGLGMLADAGTSQALVRSPRGHDPAFRATVWSIQAIRGAILCAGCLGVSALLWWAGQAHWMPVGSTYAHEALPALLCGYAICPLIHGFISTKLALAQREMRNRDNVINTLLGQLVAVPTTIAVAHVWPSVWALLAGIWVSTTVQVLASHWLIQGSSDRFGWERESLEELTGFGRWVMVSSWIGFLAGSGDRLLLSGLVSAHDMGLYALAVLLVGIVQTVFSMLLGSVVFPAFSEVFRQRPGDLPKMYLKFQRLCDAIVGLFAGGLVMSAGGLVSLMYDHRYDGVEPLVVILCAGLVGMRFQVLEQIYLAKGRPALLTLANALRLVSLFLGIWGGHHLHGLQGAVWGVAISQFATWPVALFFRQRLGLPSWRADMALLPALTVGCTLGWVANGMLTHLRSVL